MREKTRRQAIKSALLAGGFIALLSGCSKEVPEIIKTGDGRKISASEAGIPLATLADTNLLVYAVAMTGGNDGFPLSTDAKEQIIGIMSSLGYVPVILKDKMVAMAMIYTKDKEPDLNLVFFEGGFVGLNTGTYLVGNDLMKVVAVLKEAEREYNRTK